MLSKPCFILCTVCPRCALNRNWFETKIHTKNITRIKTPHFLTTCNTHRPNSPPPTPHDCANQWQHRDFARTHLLRSQTPSRTTFRESSRILRRFEPPPPNGRTPPPPFGVHWPCGKIVLLWCTRRGVFCHRQSSKTTCKLVSSEVNNSMNLEQNLVFLLWNSVWW